jgi:hypothetical protein
MPDTVRDGTGKGYLAKVTIDNQLSVKSESEEIQHHWSIIHEQAYQVIGESNLAAGTVTPIHIRNDSTTKNLVVTFIRHQLIDVSGGTEFPNANNYFKLAFGRTYSSGGTEITPVNVNNGSGKLADVTAYKGATLTGTAKEIDRWYTKDEGDMNVFNKAGAVILSPGNTMEISYVGDRTSGIIYSRLSFLMKDRGE